MKIARYSIAGEPVIAVKFDTDWYDYGAVLAARGNFQLPEDADQETIIIKMIKASVLDGDYIKTQLNPLNFRVDKYMLDLSGATPLLPMRPGKIIGVARNWKKHAEEQGKELPASPIFFVKTSNCAFGHGDVISFSKIIGRVDHEGELGVIIGKTAKGVLADNAEEHIHSYTIINDITARDYQRELQAKGYPWFAAKSMDGFAPIGPYLTLPESIGQIGSQKIEVRVNAEVRQRGVLDEMHWKVPELIEVISRNITLDPGDIIAMGTPSGIGPIVPGDVVTVEIDGLGKLVNSVGNYI